MDQFVIISLLVKPIIALLTHAAHPRTVACPVFAGRLAWAREPRGHLYARCFPNLCVVMMFMTICVQSSWQIRRA